MVRRNAPQNCDPGRHLQECFWGPGLKVPFGVLFGQFWAPASECPKECFLSVFWHFLGLKLPKSTQKNTLWGTPRQVPKIAQKALRGALSGPGPKSTPVNGGRDRNPRRRTACYAAPAWSRRVLAAEHAKKKKETRAGKRKKEREGEEQGGKKGGRNPKPHALQSQNWVVADVWEKDVWEFQAKSGSSGSCRLFLHFRGKTGVQEMSGKTPGGPRHPSSRHPSSRHPWPSDKKWIPKSDLTSREIYQTATWSEKTKHKIKTKAKRHKTATNHNKTGKPNVRSRTCMDSKNRP